MGVEGRTGEGEEEMDSVLRESARNSGPSRTPGGRQRASVDGVQTAPALTALWFLPRLPFQLLSLRSSVIGELLSPRLWDRSPEPPVLEMDIRDLEGLMVDGRSDLMGSFLERWWRTLIMASFSMIWA